MTHTPHELHEEFPDFAAAITLLKTKDAHFARLAAEYHDVNNQIHRAETNIDPMEDLAMIELRKERSRLKDEVFAALKAAQPTT
ncbi:YdcH family protein [Pseudooceanicola sp.]|uniref:YdcH family protein n=1 Tax=Pseudooceanicola sp. TaxID=1914328 RepID=UPI002613A852|nr:YdcH family protein [Pseudooceanicola sp.]MDF1853953.1 YdcH family protein [Pseudooceanicola sp.]